MEQIAEHARPDDGGAGVLGGRTLGHRKHLKVSEDSEPKSKICSSFLLLTRCSIVPQHGHGSSPWRGGWLQHMPNIAPRVRSLGHFLLPGSQGVQAKDPVGQQRHRDFARHRVTNGGA